MSISPTGLDRKSVGGLGLWFLGVSASAPMTVVAGGIVATFATAGLLGVPLAFLLVTVALLLVGFGIAALSRDVPHAAAFYAFICRGVGRAAGGASAAVALVAYNAIQISLYGLFGATMSGLVGGPWWVSALAAWAVVGVLGARHVVVNTRIVGVVVLVQLGVIGLIIAAALGELPSATDPLVVLAPASLVGPGLGGVLALTVAAFVGFESVIAYREEARSHESVRRAVIAGAVFLGLFYALSGWALVVAVGPDRIVSAAQDPTAGLPFSILAESYSPLVAGLGLVVLLTSIFAAMLAFHNVVARYVFGLARESLLHPAWAAMGGRTGGVPLGGSLVQSVIAAVTIVMFAVAGADPVAVMFTLLSTLAAVGVMVLLTATAGATIRHFANATDRPGVWRWLLAPAIGGTALLALLVVIIANLDTVTGELGTLAQWGIPLVLVLAAASGGARVLVLRRRNPGVYASIGEGQPRPLAVLDRSLSHLQL